jgi:hypothetical protein
MGACPDCGIKAEKVLELPSKGPFSQRFEDARALDLRYLTRWAAGRGSRR